MSELPPLARLLGAVPRPPAAAPVMPAETAEAAYARGHSDGLAMLEDALARAHDAAAAEQAALQGAFAGALAGLAEAAAEELAQLALAIARHVLGEMPAAVEAALVAIATDLKALSGEGVTLRADPGNAERLALLVAATQLQVEADPALPPGMVAARTATGERVDSLAMRLDRVAALLLERPE